MLLALASLWHLKSTSVSRLYHKTIEIFGLAYTPVKPIHALAANQKTMTPERSKRAKR